MKKLLLAFFFLFCSLQAAMAQIQLFGPATDSVDVPTSVGLSWIHQSAALNYKIEIDSTTNFNTARCRKVIYTGDIASLSDGTIAVQLFSNLKHNTKYFWRVQMMSISDTTYSEIRNFTTTNTVKVISPLNNATAVARDPYFQYYSRFNTSSYRYQVGTSTSTILTNPLYDEVVLSYIPYGLDKYQESFTLPQTLDPFSTYCWRIREENDSSVSAWTDIMSFTTSDKTMKMANDIQSISDNQQLYPNPANDFIHYALSFVPQQVIFYNCSGAVVYQESCTSSQGIIDTRGFTNGFYTAEFMSANGDKVLWKLILSD